jgi:hypothetical protein
MNMRLNHHEEEVYGSRAAPSAVIASITPGAGGAVHAHNTLPGGSRSGCPRFGHHRADSHRESEILGGAFQHD